MGIGSGKPKSNEWPGGRYGTARPPDPTSLKERESQFRLSLVTRLTSAREALLRARTQLAERQRADRIPQYLLDRMERTLLTLRFARYGVRNLFTQPAVLLPQLASLDELDSMVSQVCTAIEEGIGQVWLALEDAHELPLQVQQLDQALARFDARFARRHAFIAGSP